MNLPIIELIYCILRNAQPLQNISEYFKTFQLSGEKVGKNGVDVGKFVPLQRIRNITYGNNQIPSIFKVRQGNLET